MAQNRISKTFDGLQELKDAGLVAASAAATVDSVAKIIYLGLGRVEGDIIIDASAVDVATGDEGYRIGVQISSSATFASDIYEVASIQLGDSVAVAGDVDLGVGRYVLPFVNAIADGLVKQYLRLYTTVVGVAGVGVNYSAYIARD